jgi:hypothetical protein
MVNQLRLTRYLHMVSVVLTWPKRILFEMEDPLHCMLFLPILTRLEPVLGCCPSLAS